MKRCFKFSIKVRSLPTMPYIILETIVLANDLYEAERFVRERLPSWKCAAAAFGLVRKYTLWQSRLMMLVNRWHPIFDLRFARSVYEIEGN